MALEFAVYERQESTLQTLGTVLETVGNDGTISLIPKNFKDESKRVVVILKKKNGESASVTCSQQVSDGLRNKSIQLGQVLNFELLEGESGIPFISLPGGGLMDFAVKSLKAKAYEPASVSHDDLVAL